MMPNDSVRIDGDTVVLTGPDDRTLTIQLKPGDGERLAVEGDDGDHLRGDMAEAMAAVFTGVDGMIAAPEPVGVCRINRIFQRAGQQIVDPDNDGPLVGPRGGRVMVMMVGEPPIRRRRGLFG
jgi:hypothetical protein